VNLLINGNSGVGNCGIFLAKAFRVEHYIAIDNENKKRGCPKSLLEQPRLYEITEHKTNSVNGMLREV
jgi:NADPH:quinone reductase-like Zn-dependent oxidoreductase